MRKYLCVFRLRMLDGLQYRSVVLGAIVTRLLWALMEVLAYTALYSVSDASFPMTLSQTISYIYMQQALYTLFLVVFSDAEIYASITSGSIAYELLRPIDLYSYWFCQSAANRLSHTAIHCLPMLILALVLPAPFGLTLHIGAVTLGLFLLSTLLALCVVVALAMFLYISLFYLLSHRGVKIIATAVTTFFSGGVIPLPFFPEPARTLAQLLPFAAMQNVPLRIFSGELTGAGALRGVASQFFWLCVLIVGGQFAMRHAQTRLVVQGG